MHFYDEKPRKEMGFFGMKLDQRNRGHRAMEEKKSLEYRMQGSEI